MELYHNFASNEEQIFVLKIFSHGRNGCGECPALCILATKYAKVASYCNGLNAHLCFLGTKYMVM